MLTSSVRMRSIFLALQHTQYKILFLISPPIMLKNKNKKEKIEKIDGLNVDDFDALVTLHGILCAFLLSVAMQTQSDIAHTNMPYATFLAATCKQQGFRTFVHEVLNETGFDFNIPIMAGVKLDTEYELLYGVQKEFPWQSPNEIHHVSFQEEPTLSVKLDVMFNRV